MGQGQIRRRSTISGRSRDVGGKWATTRAMSMTEINQKWYYYAFDLDNNDDEYNAVSTIVK